MIKPTHPISIRITKEELRKLDQIARKRGTTRHDLMRQVVRVMVGLPTSRDVLDKVEDWINK